MVSFKTIAKMGMESTKMTKFSLKGNGKMDIQLKAHLYRMKITLANIS